MSIKLQSSLFCCVLFHSSLTICQFSAESADCNGIKIHDISANINAVFANKISLPIFRCIKIQIKRILMSCQFYNKIELN